MTTFRALTTNVAVDIDEGVSHAYIAHALVQSYAPASEPELAYHLEAGPPPRVLRDGIALAATDDNDVVPLFEIDLYEQVVARAAPGWLLHAAALLVDGRALVLCGSSGAGKTTLTLELASRGLRLLTEEVVWIGKDGVVRGLPRPIHVPAESRQRARIPRGWTELPYPLRGRDGVVMDHLLVVPPPQSLELGSVPLGALVRIGHGPDWPTHLLESPQHVALQRLWERSFRHDEGDLEAATAVLRAHGSYELSSTAVEDALRLLEPLLNTR